MSEIYRQLAQAVVQMKKDEVIRLAKLVLEQKLPPEEAIEFGLAAGMNEVGRLFACKEYFVPEVLVCARSMYGGFDILKERVVEGKIPNKGTFVIGVVDGDFHDIGKNIVKLMLEAAGFKPVDLGKNVNSEKFFEACETHNPSILAMSTLMTTTMDSMAEIAAGVQEKFPGTKIMLGGAPVNQDFVESVGAHFYGQDAREAVFGAHKVLGLPFENTEDSQ